MPVSTERHSDDLERVEERLVSSARRSRMRRRAQRSTESGRTWDALVARRTGRARRAKVNKTNNPRGTP
jgi:hypothetical protein